MCTYLCDVTDTHKPILILCINILNSYDRNKERKKEKISGTLYAYLYVTHMFHLILTHFRLKAHGDQGIRELKCSPHSALSEKTMESHLLAALMSATNY